MMELEARDSIIETVTELEARDSIIEIITVTIKDNITGIMIPRTDRQVMVREDLMQEAQGRQEAEVTVREDSMAAILLTVTVAKDLTDLAA
jgi:hypothetical protein